MAVAQFVGLATPAPRIVRRIDRIWCPREDSNLRPQDSYHFDFRRHPRGRSWSGLSLHHRPVALRCCPSSLYTFPEFLLGLARDWHAEIPAKRSPTLSRSIAMFPFATPNFIGILFSILLSYVDTQLSNSPGPQCRQPLISLDRRRSSRLRKGK